MVISTHARETPSLARHLLCAVPQLLDPNFHRAVVLMLEHGMTADLDRCASYLRNTLVSTKSSQNDWRDKALELIRAQKQKTAAK